MGGLLEGEKTVAGALSSPDRCQALPTLDVILGLVPLLSGLNLVDMAHGVDSTRIRAFGDDLGHERGA
ncbi:hypothetical protein, partial [Agrobacterium tumefaciens]|uniref:hypothetical protein n=1 Tax=Agrobacterium tumefaciens TaxID=358 RepID=UPI001BAA9BE3